MRVLTRDDVDELKPDPGMLLKALDLAGAKPDEAIFVGDAIIDIRAAKAALVRCVAVPTWPLSCNSADAGRARFRRWIACWMSLNSCGASTAAPRPQPPRTVARHILILILDYEFTLENIVLQDSSSP